MEFYCLLSKTLNFLGESVLAGYTIVLLIKIIAYCQVKKICGTYFHATETKQEPCSIKFIVSIHKSCIYFLNPIQSISITIDRKGDIGDWTSTLTSDILKINNFQGTYTIKKKPEGGTDGWFDAYVFRKPNLKIALHLHYLCDSKWVEDEGYYIERH